MQNLKEIFDRIQNAKADRKKKKQALTDVLLQSKPWIEARDKAEAARALMKNGEMEILAPYLKQKEEIEKLSLSIKDDQQLLSDIVLSQMMKGETVAVEDDLDRKWEPEIKVSFKQAKLF